MCDMERFFNDLKEGILTFKLDLCCFVFKVRAGILLCGYFNVISSMICLIAVSTGSLPPLMMNAQQSFMEGEYIKSTCAFAYSSDLCLAVLLLCGLYRVLWVHFNNEKDIVLLTYFTYCAMAMAASTVLVYSMVIGILSVLHTFLLIVSLTYQVYVILLVRSVMVELKQEAKRNYYYSGYTNYWNHNDVETFADAGTVEIYEVEEPVTTTPTKKTPEAIPDISDKTPETTPAENLAKPTVSEFDEENTNKPTTSEIAKADTKLETTKKPKALRYPYKFVAIKIPTEETIKEEKDSEDTEKDTGKEAVIKEDTTQVAKDAKKRKRSIFGRKQKSKSEDGKTGDETKNN